MTCQELILEYVSDQSSGKIFHDLTHLQKSLPRLTSCNFEDFLPASSKKSRYRLVYECLMTLSCTTLQDSHLYDSFSQQCISDIEVACWKNFVLEVYYIFKLFLPAALYFYSNTRYDKNISVARKFVLQEFSTTTSKDFRLEHYDFAEMWRAKIKFLRNVIDFDTLQANHLVNFQKLLPEKSTEQTSLTVPFDVIEQIANTIYPKFSFLVNNRSFLICREKTAESKFKNVFKLRFVAPMFCKSSIGRYKVETQTPLCFFFHLEEDLNNLVRIHNTFLRDGNCRSIETIPIFRISKKVRLPILVVENFYHRLCRPKETPVMKSQNIETPDFCNIQQCIEKKGFASVYKLNDYYTMAYVKNRVMHLTATFQQPLSRKPFLEKKGRKVARIEKMTRALTMTRYKSKFVNKNTVSFNVNYQGPASMMQLTLSRLLNENKSLGCHITKPVWVSNVCTTTDTTHSGILNAHVYRRECFQNSDRVTYPMMNFPAVVTLIDDSEKKKSHSVIINRTSINTCRMYGEELKTSLAQWCEFVRQCSEIDEDLVKIFFRIESHFHELLPRNLVLLIHVLYLQKEELKLSNDDIVLFFTERLLVSRTIMTSNRSFTTYPLFDKKYQSDAVDNVSVKSFKSTRKNPPMITRADSLRRYREKFGDVGAFSKAMFRQRGRNSNVIDLILNSKDDFFYSSRCTKLLRLLCQKYHSFPSTTSAISMLTKQTQKGEADLQPKQFGISLQR